MARYKCPCCGAAFNGKRCRNCYYEVFTEEITHGLHTHSGEPLVIDAPVRRPIRRKDPFGCDQSTRRKPPQWLSLVIAVTVFLFSFAGAGIEAIVDDLADSIVPEPEPVPEIAIPSGTTVLYDENDLYVAAHWQEGMDLSAELPIYLINRSGRALNMVAHNVTVNGCVMENAYLYAGTEDRQAGLSYLHIEEGSLVRAGIDTIAELSFRLEFYNEDSYDTYAVTDYVTLCAVEDYVQPVDDSGTLLWEDEGIRVIFQGYRADPNHPEELTEGVLQFYIENTGDRTLTVYSQEVTVNQEETWLGLWCELRPGCRIVTDMYLYDLAELGIRDPEDIQDFAITLDIRDPDDWEYAVTTGPLPVDIGK